MSLARSIQTAREQQSLTQTALADQAGVDVRSLKRLESGANTALKTVEAVCSVLNLSPTTGQALIPCKPRLSRKDIKELIRVRDGELPVDQNNVRNNDVIEVNIFRMYLCFGIFLPILGEFSSLFAQSYNKINTLEISLINCFIIFSSFYLPNNFGFLFRNKRIIYNVFLFNGLLEIISNILNLAYPVFFSVWAIPALLSIGGAVVFGTKKMKQKSHQISCDLQHELEDIIKQLSRPNPNLDALEQTLFGLILESKKEMDFDFGRPFEVLVWLIQDLRLGIAQPDTMQPYFRVAGEMAQNITQSDQYAALVKARQGDKDQQKSLEVRRQNLYKKGIRHLKALRRDLRACPLPI